MSIKAKVGKCIDCPKGVWDAPLIADRCVAHYWQYRASLKADKTDRGARNSTIPQRSEKQLSRDIAYAKLRKKWLPEHQLCEAKLKGCTRQSTQVHHRQGRMGDLLTDTSKWLAVCWSCHNFITEHSNEAFELGLSIRRNT